MQQLFNLEFEVGLGSIENLDLVVGHLMTWILDFVLSTGRIRTFLVFLDAVT